MCVQNTHFNYSFTLFPITSISISSVFFSRMISTYSPSYDEIKKNLKMRLPYNHTTI